MPSTPPSGKGLTTAAQLVDGGVPIFHARLPVRELLRGFLVVCVEVDFLLDLVAHIREGQVSRRTDGGEPIISHVRSSSLQRNKAPESRRLVLGGLIQPVGVAWAMQIRTPPPRRRNLHLMLDTVP